METKENKEWDLARYAVDEPIKWSFTEIEILLTVVRLMQGSSSNKQQLKLGFDLLKRLSNSQVPDESIWLGILEEFQFKAMRLNNYNQTESIIGGSPLFIGITLDLTSQEMIISSTDYFDEVWEHCKQNVQIYWEKP
jgi:hypothetical protein